MEAVAVVDALKSKTAISLNTDLAALTKPCFGKLIECDESCDYADACKVHYSMFMEDAEAALKKEELTTELNTEYAELATLKAPKIEPEAVKEADPIAEVMEKVVAESKPNDKVEKEIKAPVKKTRLDFDWKTATERIFAARHTKYSYCAKIVKGMLPVENTSSAYNYTNKILETLAKDGIVVWKKGDRALAWMK